METQELQTERLGTPPADRETTIARKDVAAGAEVTPARAEEARGADVHEVQADACEHHDTAMDLSQNALDEDETQLAVIRELMLRACARGVWLSLGEIADATEFAEASISAQLRHLRKPHHGAHCVQKRRRSAGRGGVVKGTIGDGRRGTVIWEYRVLPPA
jgi:hypothetical protein